MGFLRVFGPFLGVFGGFEGSRVRGNWRVNNIQFWGILANLEGISDQFKDILANSASMLAYFRLSLAFFRQKLCKFTPIVDIFSHFLVF